MSLSPTSGAGTSAVFTAVYSDANGYNDTQEAHLLLQTSLNGTNACSPRYNVQSNEFYLLDDTGQYWLGPIAPNSSQSVQNTQCVVTGASYATPAGDNLTVYFSVTFLLPFAGAKNTYLYVGNASTGYWQLEHSWTVNGIAPLSVSPASGTGMNQVFSAVYTDTAGYTDIRQAYVLLTAGALTGINTCAPRYDATLNAFYLLNDAGNGWISGSPLQNSQCILNTSGSYASGSGNNLTVTFNVTFTLPAFAGTKNTYLYAGNATTGVWNLLGTYAVGAALITTNVTDFGNCIGQYGTAQTCVLAPSSIPYVVTQPLIIGRGATSTPPLTTITGGGGPGDTILQRSDSLSAPS